jgi:ubiquitin-conjugating enzyme E2 O
MMRRAGIEWKQMSSGLPAGVTVQVYEGRMNLLRAAIEGPADTPYEGGLFVFDIYLPPSYPAAPPKAYYWAYGKYINPNLYECGKVCLSLLGTWSGPGWEKDTSTLLQLFVSIQGLILIEAPYCNEPGQQRDGGTEQSMQYNRMVQAGVVDNMTKMIAAPPIGLSTVVSNFVAREGPGLLRRAVVLGNSDCTSAHITALDTALEHPFGTKLSGPVENTGSDIVGGVTEEMPRWLTVADAPFTSGYVDDQMDDDY